jgi:hypothetical protein
LSSSLACASGLLAVLTVGAGLAAVACGPSFQAVYEGDVRFEHCYALDQGPVSPDAKKECWSGWLHDYTYGQSRDRVEYAGTRFSELSLDPTLPTEERPVKHAQMQASPVPTSAFAPPPSLAERVTTEAAASGTTAPPPGRTPVAAVRAPGEECAEGCSGYWKTCKASCKGAACEACDKAYKLCVPGCFKR